MGTAKKFNKNHRNRVTINIHKTEIHDHSIPSISTGNQLKVTGLNNSLWAVLFLHQTCVDGFFSYSINFNDTICNKNEIFIY
jgi:hypothetical protein